MAKNIHDGVEQIRVRLQEKQNDQQLQAWRVLRNKMDSLLLSTNILKSDEAKQQCLQLDTMADKQRREHILTYWGPTYLQRMEPLLHQLKVLEIEMSKSQGNSAES